MTYKEFVDYCSLQEEKPQYTSKFIMKYQQTNSGVNSYLHKAIVDGHIIHRCEGEPNQRWHLLESWYPEIKDVDVKVKSWCGLRCPELLLWIAEVSGQKDKVRRVVERILEDDSYSENDFIARNRMVQYIKKEIQWDDVMTYIGDHFKDNM